MKVIIIGAGVIGITTAYYLAKAGAQVKVLERLSGPALDTSFANAGELSYGYSTPWAAPGIPMKAIKWLFQKHAPLAAQWDGSLFQLRWMLQLLKNCSPHRYSENKERMLRIANYSRYCLEALREETGIEYEGRSSGTLQLFRTARQIDNAQRDMQSLRECGVVFSLLDASQVSLVEPALAYTNTSIAGGLYLPDDETGDCFAFTSALAEMTQQLGVDICYNTEVSYLSKKGGEVDGVYLSDGSILQADNYIISCGSYSRPLLKELKLDLPIYPVKGYSLTIPIAKEELSPVSTVLDETYKIAITRFSNRIRVGGMAELSGFNHALKYQRKQTLEMVVSELFPGGDMPWATFWTGLRPMTPDGTPILGRSPIRNLYLNTGHGTLGWTMACASARIVTDIVTGQSPEISTDNLELDRYFRHR